MERRSPAAVMLRLTRRVTGTPGQKDPSAEHSQLPEPRSIIPSPECRTMQQLAIKQSGKHVHRVGNKKKDVCAQTVLEPLVFIPAIYISTPPPPRPNSCARTVVSFLERKAECIFYFLTAHFGMLQRVFGGFYR